MGNYTDLIEVMALAAENRFVVGSIFKFNEINEYLICSERATLLEKP